MRDVSKKLISVLRMYNFKSHVLDCSVLNNGTSDSSTTHPSMDSNEFGSRLVEEVAESPLLTFYRNSTHKIEYFLKVVVFGQDENDLRLPTDETTVALTELAMIDNSVFSVTPNVSFKAPRRFFRIGVAQVEEIKLSRSRHCILNTEHCLRRHVPPR